MEERKCLHGQGLRGACGARRSMMFFRNTMMLYPLTHRSRIDASVLPRVHRDRDLGSTRAPRHETRTEGSRKATTTMLFHM